MNNSNIEVGNTFGFLEVIALHSKNNRGKSWLCKCICGKELAIQASDLIGYKSKRPRKSCGCKQRLQDGYAIKYPELYFKWKEMIRRCNDPFHTSRAYYLDKGIQVEKEWKEDFKVFVEWSLKNGYQETLSLDRIDCDGNYSPENCRWADNLTQAQNRGIHKDNKTGVNGSIRTPNGRLHVYITRNFKRYNLGMYDTITEAKVAREKAEAFYEEYGSLDGYEPQWKRLRKEKKVR